MSHDPPQSLSSSSDALARAAAAFERRNQVEFDIDFYASLLEREPNYVDVLRRQGELLTCQGQHQRALAIDLRLAALCPDDCVVLYNLACSLALVGQGDEAIEVLGRAIAAGYDDLDHLMTDTDLAALHQHPQFEPLLRRLARKNRRADKAPH
jgi:tetratricopeptide (TPR) repeat protein